MLRQTVKRVLTTANGISKHNQIQIRHRSFKKKWAVNLKKKEPSDHALEHFDRYYSEVYGSLWPSIRLSLLSQPKHCALVNNFADAPSCIDMLHEYRAADFIAPGREQLHKQSFTEEDIQRKMMHLNPEPEIQPEEVYELEPKSLTNTPEDLNEFMPVTKIVSEKQQMREDEARQNVFQGVGNTKFTMMPFPELVLPKHIRAMVHDRGEVQRFLKPKPDSTGKLSYYLMDAASILPVLALHLTPDCSVLDLCAAPGGKTLAMLQSLMPGNVVCMDHSYSRLQRLKEVLRWYTPPDYADKVQVVKRDGTLLQESGVYDRVLVDVPCFTDRHVLHSEEDNIFRPVRIKQRVEIQHLQRDLLFAGIRACKPGGYVVYSTCTLSMPQNDGIIQRTLDKLWAETDIDIAIKDTSPLVHCYRDTFNFHAGTRFGQLVLPNITANFGPIYFCALQRLN